MMHTTPKDYRKDIDGLRAIAVIAVILHHLNNNLLPGGYIGVDIFFVISGFLITSHIFNALKTNTFSFATFYKKRINRIIPALLSVITLSIGVGLILLSPTDLIRLANSALTSLTGLSNIYFWREYGNYFSANTDEAILLHTWSLGVEEQFYLIWPILLCLITAMTQKPRVILCLVSIILITTLALSEYATSLFASASYYLLPSRFFELAMGGLLALYTPKKTYNALVCFVIKAIGILLIAYAIFAFNAQTHFPGFNALIPCLGACLIILAGNLAHPSYILSLKPFQITGLLSYSLYLWHWPIIAYINYLYIPITLTTNAIIIVAVYLLSYITWKYIELPARTQGNKKTFLSIFTTRFVIPVLVLLLFVLATYQWHGFPQRFPIQAVKLEQITQVKPNELRQGCHVTNQFYQTELNQDCILGIDKPSIDGLLAGDSYANHFSGMIDEIAKAKSLHIVDYTMDACPPILNYGNELTPSYASRCIARNKHIHHLITNTHYQYIILAANWPQNEEVYPYLKETLQQYLKTGSQLIIILKNPAIPHAATCPIRKVMFNLSTDCAIKQQPSANYWAKLKQLFPQVIFIDPNPLICPMGQCSPILQNTPLYRDDGHLNDIGARLLGKELLKQRHLLEIP